MTGTAYQWLRATLGASLLMGCLAHAQEPPPVAVVTADKRPVIREIRVTGSVLSLANADLSTEVAGRVDSLVVDLGAKVDAGDPLLRLDPELEQARLDSARASVREARARLDDARRRLKEAQSLGSSQGVSESEVRSLEAEVRMEEAALERLQADARRQAQVVERHVLRAPFAGVVSRRMVDSGEWVSPGTGVLGLVALDQLRADFAVAQQYYPAISKGSGVRIRLAALPERSFPARIEAVAPVNNADARTFTVRAAFEDPKDAAITPGMSARATLSVDTGRESVSVPRDALLRHPDGRVTVWVVPPDQKQPKVEERQVKLGLTFDDHVEIRSGLEPGETVVTRGNEALQPEQTVRVTDSAGG